MTKRLLVFGAGAIGRGYIPWVFPDNEFDLTYVEANPTLRDKLNQNQGFTTLRTIGGAYEKKRISVYRCLAPSERILDDFDAVITAVGPRQVLELRDVLRRFSCPIVLFENDADLVDELRRMMDRENVYFGVPDVISSNTASQQTLNDDPLSIVTEDGECFIDDRAKALGGCCKFVNREELQKQWIAKLYIHNTPHCIAAYLGAISKKQYLHEGMGIPKVYQIVEGAIQEMRVMVGRKFGLNPEFLTWYAEKELARFSNQLLCDPIVRVAREPFRKLEPNNRLIGAAQLALSCGITPDHIIKGIIAAFRYCNSEDPDANIQILVSALRPEDFLNLIIRLRPGEALFDLIVENWEAVTAEIEGIIH